MVLAMHNGSLTVHNVSKNLKKYKTKLYFAIKVSVIKIDNDFITETKTL